MQYILSYSLFGNTVLSYLIGLSIFIGGIIILFLFKKYFLSKLKKWVTLTKTSFDDMLFELVQKNLHPIFYLGLFYFVIKSLKLSPSFKFWLNSFFIIFITVLCTKMFTSILSSMLRIYLKKSQNLAKKEKQLKGIYNFFVFLIWIIVLISILDNFGVKVTAVAAGLGIGGVAVALASQVMLGDLFSYFIIFFDKPFELGDFLIVDDKLGTIESIGIKTTRMRSLSGEQLVFPNANLINSRIHNYKKMEQRRVLFKLNIIYQTSYNKLKMITPLIREIINKQSDVIFDRGHFASYDDFSLTFEFVYYVIGADYNKYMDIQQEINFSIFESFEKEGIEFAYPSQTIFIKHE